MVRIEISKADVLVSQVSPQQGIRAGFAESDAGNAPFATPEIARISQGLQEVREAMVQRRDLNAEQVDLISRKLDEMQEAAERLGRRDWINLAIGTLTTTIVSAALGPDAGRGLFQALGSALAWLFGGPPRFLP